MNMAAQLSFASVTTRERYLHALENPEVSEFMVRRLDGQINEALHATPDSGVVFDGIESCWVPEHERDDDL